MEQKQKTNQDSTEPTKSKGPSLYGRGEYKWEIYPDFWKKSWGIKPKLGVVYANDEFYAKRIAYDRGLLPVNWTFEPEPVKVGPAGPPPERHKAPRNRS